MQHYGRFFLIFFAFAGNGCFFSVKVFYAAIAPIGYKTETAFIILNGRQKLILFNQSGVGRYCIWEDI
ncbi:hypothetical protein C7N43_09750 [Sphingobacteriales bacterium UPWRP_1]|nr:hypothetical protein B6N25_11855 [Sphingobacteriales bacterium TSM_CSS]PSJ77217.1 hypothetical protein C7N43_09750 [Sphingobacteriales bacterium UPWRP_1]